MWDVEVAVASAALVWMPSAVFGLADEGDDVSPSGGDVKKLLIELVLFLR